jgi:hypothetical protein
MRMSFECEDSQPRTEHRREAHIREEVYKTSRRPRTRDGGSRSKKENYNKIVAEIVT